MEFKMSLMCDKDTEIIKKEHKYKNIKIDGVFEVSENKKFSIKLNIKSMTIFTSIDDRVFVDLIDTDGINIDGKMYNLDTNSIAAFTDFDGDIEWSDVIEESLIDLGLV